MKASSISEIKQELKNLTEEELRELCLRLAKYKKENKELLNFLLFQSNDLQGYIENVKEMMRESFGEINKSNIYFAKKGLRKILRITNKHIKYTGSRQGEIELLVSFCERLILSGIAIHKNPALNNMYKNQLKKIHAAIKLLHEDLQYDYLKIMEQFN